MVTTVVLEHVTKIHLSHPDVPHLILVRFILPLQGKCGSSDLDPSDEAAHKEASCFDPDRSQPGTRLRPNQLNPAVSSPIICLLDHKSGQSSEEGEESSLNGDIWHSMKQGNLNNFCDLPLGLSEIRDRLEMGEDIEVSQLKIGMREIQ